MPYFCTDLTAWLGPGYYFWDSFIENAHWWAKVRRYNGYFICEASYIHDHNYVFDLVGNSNHILKFKEIIEKMKQIGMVNKETTVPRILAIMRDFPGWEWSAIRANGIQSREKKSEYNYDIMFQEGLPAFLELSPTIQICFLNLENPKLNFSNYKEIYHFEEK